MYIALSILTVVSTILFFVFIRHRTAHLEQFSNCIDIFYQSADKLMDDPDVPKELIDVLQYVSNNLYNRRLLREIFFDLITGRIKQGYASGQTARYDEALSSLRAPLQRIYLRALAAGIVAMTFQSPVFGTLVRRLALFSITLSKNNNGDSNFDDSGKIIALDLVQHAREQVAA